MDIVYRLPAYCLARKLQKVTVYEFMWRSPAFGDTYGSGHGAELPFVFNNLDEPDWKYLVGNNKDHSLAKEIQEKWVGFACKGGEKKSDLMR